MKSFIEYNVSLIQEERGYYQLYLPDQMAGPDGTRMLMLFVTGIIGLGFPWPGPTSAKFVVALLNGLRKLIHSW